jgi:hypothetical protein
MFICCSGSILLGRSLFAYPSVPDTFEETDLIGTWQATYGTALTKDTITLKADGTYQQIFQSPESDYFYTGPWNKWHLEYTADGKPKLHLENMRYCAGTIEGCEATGRGEPTIYYDFVEREYIKLTNEVILRVLGDEDSPRGIRLWNLSTDEDDGPTSFVLIDG